MHKGSIDADDHSPTVTKSPLKARKESDTKQMIMSSTKGSAISWDDADPAETRGSLRSHKSARGSNKQGWGDEPVVDDEEDEDPYPGSDSGSRQQRSGGGLEDDDVDGAPMRTNSSASEFEPTDYILIPEGMRDKKPRDKKGVTTTGGRAPSTATTRRPAVPAQDDSTPRSDLSSGDVIGSPREDKLRYPHAAPPCLFRVVPSCFLPPPPQLTHSVSGASRRAIFF